MTRIHFRNSSSTRRRNAKKVMHSVARIRFIYSHYIKAGFSRELMCSNIAIPISIWSKYHQKLNERSSMMRWFQKPWNRIVCQKSSQRALKLESTICTKIREKPDHRISSSLDKEWMASRSLETERRAPKAYCQPWNANVRLKISNSPSRDPWPFN